jgi:murein DD-endopeptidase MepM/ murein hydrolase activator NlpD
LKKISPASLGERLVLLGAWLVAISVVLFAVYLGWRVRRAAAATPIPPVSQESQPFATATLPAKVGDLVLPSLNQDTDVESISRLAELHTTFPERPRQEAITYTVEIGDAVFSIAKSFKLEPETVLWANYDLLKDSPDALSPGMQLRIPPVNGVYYEWAEGDTLDGVANKFDAEAGAIVNFAGNKLDLASPEIQPGQWVMIPDGHREFQQWVIPVIPRGQAGVAKSIYGAGACDGGYTGGAYGTGFFVWPTSTHTLSGNDYWSGHLGIDIAAGIGDPVYAADSGVVVFSGLSSQGYGYMIMIDHGNGYQTLYAHMSAYSVYCGQDVYQSGYIGATGNSGNSTGSHLHFEVRYLGGFVSPWYVLPAP